MQDVLKLIANADQDELEAVFAAARARLSALRDQEKLLNLMTLRVGDTAVLHNISPKRLSGKKVVVVRKSGERFMVKLADGEVPDYRLMGEVSIPASCLQKV